MQFDIHWDFTLTMYIQPVIMANRTRTINLPFLETHLESIF